MSYKAPYNPNPVTPTVMWEKFYHWTWKHDRKTKKMKITLHAGKAESCRRQHMDQDGTLYKLEGADHWGVK